MVRGTTQDLSKALKKKRQRGESGKEQGEKKVGAGGKEGQEKGLRTLEPEDLGRAACGGAVGYLTRGGHVFVLLKDVTGTSRAVVSLWPKGTEPLVRHTNSCQ